MIPSNPSTDNGSQVNQMTCQFTTGFSEKKKQLCFQRPKLQEHLWGRFSSSAPWKIGNMLGRQFFSFAFGGQRYLFSRAICIYIYIFLKLRIRSRYPLSTGCGFVPCQPFHLRMWQSMLWLQRRCSQKSSNKVGSPQQLFALVFWSKKVTSSQMVSWKLEIGIVERFDVFFCFPVIVFFCFTTFNWWVGLLKIRSVVLPFFWWWSKH